VLRRIPALLLALMLLMGSLAPALAQPGDPAAQLLARMSPEARVGQLFIVTFPGTDTSEAAAIHTLITQDDIGGVLLRADLGNIVNEGDTPAQVAALTSELQRLAWTAALTPSVSGVGENEGDLVRPFVPLFIALEQDRNPLMPGLGISGTTQLVSPMALGATWDPSYAGRAGTVAGAELNALGFNLLLGPSLDVLDTPRPGSAADLGVRSFGGDPYWVGQMGAAYIRGVHDGSGGRVAVVPGHFPGLGAADRPLSEEVSTVQKSLEQLKQIELAPFFTVTSAEDPLSQADGLLVSHIRYRGFQGNIYQSTKPVSFDPQALQQLLALPELAAWRQAGGVTVADDLGVRAVRRFYDPSEQDFNGLRIAREAFVAGNDLLILSHFALTDDWDAHIANVRATIAFFRERYNSDPTFQSWVDEAVLRILRLKLRIYGGDFTLSATQRDNAAVGAQVGIYNDQIASIARAAVTLLSPPSPELRGAPPAAGEYIVIFTDDRQILPCFDCAQAYAIPPTMLADTLLRLYGPRTTNQVQPNRLSSFTFSELVAYMDAPPRGVSAEGTPEPPSAVEAALSRANWIVFAMLDPSAQVQGSNAVRRFLAEQANALQNKKIVVLAFGAPYYLDTTEIAKLSLYFGLYSHAAPSVDAAARALFDEFPFSGDSPVSVSGINYQLMVQTQPDPGQIIQILYEVVGQPPAEGTPLPTPPAVEVRRGDTLQLRTSVIVDRNGHAVPDGTPVEFIFTYPQEGLEHTVQGVTHGGVARTTITLERVGQLQISVRAEPVPRAVRLEMNIPEGPGPADITFITPTPTPTPLPTPTETPSPPPEEVPAPPGQSSEVEKQRVDRVSWLDLLLALMAVAVIALTAYAGLWRRRRDLSRALQGALWCAIGGLVAYIVLALGLPGADWLRRQAGVWTAALAAGAGALIPLGVMLLSNAWRSSARPLFKAEE